jgi:hypothetical protein
MFVRAVEKLTLPQRFWDIIVRVIRMPQKRTSVKVPKNVTFKSGPKSIKRHI